MNQNVQRVSTDKCLNGSMFKPVCNDPVLLSSSVIQAGNHSVKRTSTPGLNHSSGQVVSRCPDGTTSRSNLNLLRIPMDPPADLSGYPTFHGLYKT